VKFTLFGDFIAGPNGGDYTCKDCRTRGCIIGWVIGGTMGCMYAFHILEFELWCARNGGFDF
jgi:hypothetical protein